MEVDASSLEKKETNEVILMISGLESQSRGPSPKPNTNPIELENPPPSSPFSNLTSPSGQEITEPISTPSELPNITTKESIPRSSFVKQKSRSVELPHPSEKSAVEEEDEEGVCETMGPESQVLSSKSKFVLTQWVMFVCITGLLIASSTISNLRNTVIWHVHLWGWCLLMLATFCGRLVTDCLIHILIILIENKYLLKKKVLYFLYALKNSAEVFAWLFLVLLAWVVLMKHGVKRSRHTAKILSWVTRVLLSCLIGAALWMIKTFLIKFLAGSFQCKRFFDRIQEYIFNQHVIRTLSIRRPAKSATCMRAGPRKYIKGAAMKPEEVNIEKLSKIKPDKVSAWTMRSLINIVSRSELSSLTGSLDNIDNNVALKQEKDITDETEAKTAAQAIFKNVAKPKSK